MQRLLHDTYLTHYITTDYSEGYVECPHKTRLKSYRNNGNGKKLYKSTFFK